MPSRVPEDGSSGGCVSTIMWPTNGASSFSATLKRCLSSPSLLQLQTRTTVLGLSCLTTFSEENHRGEGFPEECGKGSPAATLITLSLRSCSFASSVVILPYIEPLLSPIKMIEPPLADWLKCSPPWATSLVVAST